MSSIVDFETVVVPISAAMWRATRKLRGHTNHGAGHCPQRTQPLKLSATETACAPCSSLHHQALLEAHRGLTSELKRGRTTASALRDRNGRFTRTQYEQWTIDASRRLATEIGMCAKIDRLPDTKWFAEALPEPLDRALICDLLYFVRSADECSGAHVFPVQRWADRYSTDSVRLSASDVQQRVVCAIERLSAAKPQFVEDNIERPLSRRSSAGHDIDQQIAESDVLDAVLERVDAQRSERAHAVHW